ncbi:hypothetical protein GGER_23790 [Serratia rubidaea]
MLSIKDLRVSAEDNEILKGLSLEIKPGEVHAIMGPNGSGKSTLSATLAGREEYEVSGGSVTFKGKDLLELDPEDRAGEGVFLAFQYPVEIPGVSNHFFCRPRSMRCANTAAWRRWTVSTSPILSKRRSRCWICRPTC